MSIGAGFGRPTCRPTSEEVGRIERIERMRADFAVVVRWMREMEAWSEADEAELGALIRAAVESQRVEDVEGWADYLAAEAARIAAIWPAQACREAEARIRDGVAAQRAQQQRRAA